MKICRLHIGDALQCNHIWDMIPLPKGPKIIAQLLVGIHSSS